MSAESQRRVAALLSRLMESPRGYLHSLDLAKGTGLVIEVGPRFFQEAVFLDGRVLKPGMTGGWVPLDRIWREVEKAPKTAKPVHFIFHAGHAGSTLVSRLLDETPNVLGVREPETLRVLAMLYNQEGDKGFKRLFDNVYALLARRFEEAETVIVKATSICSTFAPQLLAKRPENRAVVLTVSLKTYLANLLDKHEPADIPAFAQHRLKGLQKRIPGFSLDLAGLSLGELTAFSWLAEIEALHQLTAPGLDERTLFLDFDRFLQRRGPSIRAVLRHFGFSREPGNVKKLEQSAVFETYAKQPDFPFTADSRATILAESMAANAAQIAAGEALAERLAARYPALKQAMEYFQKN